jgi:hypothetical protein
MVQALSPTSTTASCREALTKATLARTLAPFGVRPTIVYRSRTKVSRGFLAKDFQDMFRRYLSQ